MSFERDLGDGVALALRTPAMANAVRRVAAANLDRLRLWEPWAHTFNPDGSDDDWNREQLRRYLDGTALPTVVLVDGSPAGSVSAHIDPYTGTAQLGYWISAEQEGRGIVRRACRALISDLASDGIARVEIRTAVNNRRSIRVAESLGFLREGTLRSALPVGSERHDVAVFGLVLDTTAPGAQTRVH